MNHNKLRRIALITSGGNAPGMDYFIHAVVRAAQQYDIECIGVTEGARGLTADRSGLVALTPAGMQEYFRHIKNPCGTILGGAVDGHKFEEWEYDNLRNRVQAYGVDAVIGIGGDGSARYVPALFKAAGVDTPFIFATKTIDDDVPGVWGSLGHHSAASSNADMVDKLYGFASSHNRVMLVEVMGRENGSLALHSAALSKWADIVLVPEIQPNADAFEAALKVRLEHGQRQVIVVVSEGFGGFGQGTCVTGQLPDGTHTVSGAMERVQSFLKQERFNELLKGKRVTLQKIGYAQRGTTVSSFDKMLGVKLGVRAVRLAMNETGSWVVTNKGYPSMMNGTGGSKDRLSVDHLPLNEFLDFAAGGKSRDPETIHHLNRLTKLLNEKGISTCGEAPDGQREIYENALAKGRVPNALTTYFAPALPIADVPVKRVRRHTHAVAMP